MNNGINRREFLGGLLTTSSIGLCGSSYFVYAADTPVSDALQRGFSSPPHSAAPWVYWYWISENISQQGISRDLEQMALVGIGAAMIGIVQDLAPSGAVTTLSPEWWQLVTHAVAEGQRTGVEIGFFNCPGWSQSGGPWIKPRASMRYIASSELRVQGPARLERKLEAPHADFQDVALLAFRTPRHDGESLSAYGAAVTATPALDRVERLFDNRAQGGCVLPAEVVGFLPRFGVTEPAPETPPQHIDIVAAKAFTARSLSLTALPRPLWAEAELFYQTSDGSFVSVKRFAVDRRSDERNRGPMLFSPVLVAFPATTSRHFRLVLSRIQGGKGCGLANICLSGAARVERYIEKQLGIMQQTPTPDWNAYHWPKPVEPEEGSLVMDPAGIVDLSKQLDADGTLRWDVPDGDWIILRSGMAPTGVSNGPAPPAATGLEVDKMNAAAVEAHFDAYVGQLLDKLPASHVRNALRYVVADSYEAGPQNWTDGFEQVFIERYGYDPRPWLPVLTGRVVGSADRSDRFLWDLRRLVADKIAANYVGALRKVSAKHGLTLWLENYGHWGFAAEFLQYGGFSDRVGGEFWTMSLLGDTETLAASSAAAIYGKPLASAEAFTSVNAWRDHPGSLKARGDWAFARDINHFVLHVYIHQPDERSPGVNARFGTEFNRHNTWFPHGRPWIDYLRRASFLLQQGSVVAEIAYFTGDIAPQMTGPVDPAPPAGYKFIFINAETIEQRLSVREGRFVLPEGASFAVLVLPNIETMRPVLLAKIANLVAAGGTIVGAPPLRSPSLQDFPRADAELAKLAKMLWGAGERNRFGQGQVFPYAYLQEALLGAGAKPSLEGGIPAELLWTHRRTPAGDIYFFSNQGARALSFAPALCSTQGSLEVWDAISGAVLPLNTFERDGNRLRFHISLPAAGSVFVLTRNVASQANAVGLAGPLGVLQLPLLPIPRDSRLANRGLLRRRHSRVIDAEWRVSFPTLEQPNRNFTTLISWSEHEDPAIRYFSGTAVYRSSLKLSAANLRADQRIILDLGQVGVIAEVRVNGRDCGAVWTAPYAVDIGDALHSGTNRIEIAVTNVWYNRLLGMKEYPNGVPGLIDAPWTAVKPNLDGALQPSGLIGPVALHWIGQGESQVDSAVKLA